MQFISITPGALRIITPMQIDRLEILTHIWSDSVDVSIAYDLPDGWVAFNVYYPTGQIYGGINPEGVAST